MGVSLNELKKVNISLKSDSLSYHKGFIEYFDKNEKLKKENKELKTNLVTLIKEYKIMASTLEKNKLIPEVQEKQKNEKEVERVLRRSKRENLEL